jgi:molybdopterin-binding protein
MPRKDQGWITFQTSEEERRLLEEFCHLSQRSKTEILRELVRSLGEQKLSARQPSRSRKTSPASIVLQESTQHDSEISAQRKALKISSRNILKGRVTRVVTGSVNSEVTLEIVHKVELISIITKASAEELGLEEGKEAYAVIKSSDVAIAME